MAAAEGGCPARIRTSIDGVRVRSLTIRRRGSLGSGEIERALYPVNAASWQASGVAQPHKIVIKTGSSQPRGLRGEGQKRACTMAQGVASAPALQPGFKEQGRPSNPGSPPRREKHRHTYGAIDLGTNNCRLLIARPNEGGFTVIDAFSRIVRLGEGLSRTGELSQEAMDRAVAALSVCGEKLVR